MISSSLIKERARFAAENILTRSIRAIHPSTSISSSPTSNSTSSTLQATKKWPTPKGQHGVVVVHDEQPNELAQHLLQGYADFFASPAGKDFNGTLRKFPGQTFLEDSTNHEDSSISNLVCPGGAVILIQNHAFQNQTNTYRLRLPLMEMGLRVVEHPHLIYATTPLTISTMNNNNNTTTSNSEEDEEIKQPIATLDELCYNYIESCCLDPDECDREAKRIGAILDEAESTSILCRDHPNCKELKFSGRLEKCLYNTGKFWNEEAIECGMKGVPSSSPSSSSSSQVQQQQQSTRPIGGSYPFGEVISESVLLSGLNGECDIFAFPNIRRTMSRVPLDAKPFRVKIERGAVVDIADDAPQDFVDLLNMVREAEGEVVVRELGIGMNKALSPQRMLGDVTSFERQWGVHLSLGKRHPLFVKNADRTKESARKIGFEDDKELKAYDFLKRKHGKYHLDVFLDVHQIVTDKGKVVEFYPK